VNISDILRVAKEVLQRHFVTLSFGLTDLRMIPTDRAPSRHSGPRFGLMRERAADKGDDQAGGAGGEQGEHDPAAQREQEQDRGGEYGVLPGAGSGP
jgi:hypothetical protein